MPDGEAGGHTECGHEHELQLRGERKRPTSTGGCRKYAAYDARPARPSSSPVAVHRRLSQCTSHREPQTCTVPNPALRVVSWSFVAAGQAALWYSGALSPDTSDEAFRITVRARRPGWSPDNHDVLGGEHGVERSGELRVSVADQESKAGDLIAEVHDQVAGPLGGPLGGRMGRDAQDVHPAAGDLHDEQHVQPAQGDRVKVEKSVASSPEACARRNVRQLVSTSRGAGPILAAARIRRIVRAPTRCPSPTSSPCTRRCPHARFS